MDRKISFVINCSKNTLQHMKLLLKSLEKNLSKDHHEILIFVDSDNEGLTEYLIEQAPRFKNLKVITHKVKPCVGYSRNNNLLVELAEHDIVSYLQSDMVIGPNYDQHILEELEDNCILSSTRIEPPLHGPSNVVITADFGTDPTTFDLDRFNEFSNTHRQDKQVEFFFAPFTFYKEVWLSTGGYDTRFRRSREDSDLLQRFIQKGVKIKQTFKANVYHFTCVSSRGVNWHDAQNEAAQRRVQMQQIADGVELDRFFRKWGSFRHDNQKIVNIDVDLVVDENAYTESLSQGAVAYTLEPYYSRVWVPTEEVKQTLLEFYKAQHGAANELLDFTEEDWVVAKKYYNQDDFESRILVGKPTEYNVAFTPTATTTPIDQRLAHIKNILLQVPSTDPGVYEVEGLGRLEVRKIVDLSPSNIVVTNPPFPLDLLTIHHG